MKKPALFVVTALLLFIGCTTQQEKEDIEGVWEMVSAHWFYETLNITYPQDMEGGQIKSWQDGYVLLAGTIKWTGTIKIDSMEETVSYMAASYTLDGNKYQENVIYHDWTVPEGTVINMILEVHGDTLIQKFPADENWNLGEEFMYEKYVRVE